jgi:hypothetical protein
MRMSSYTIHFGACDDGRLNCIPTTPGWNYVVRLYQPREEIINGSWTFPDPVPLQLLCLISPDPEPEYPEALFYAHHGEASEK